MKTIAFAFLFLFGAFLATPTVVTLLKHDADVSYMFNLNEEENSSSSKESKKVVKNAFLKFFSLTALAFGFAAFLGKGISFYSIKFFKPVYLDLVSPPPELA